MRELGTSDCTSQWPLSAFYPTVDKTLWHGHGWHVGDSLAGLFGG